MNLHSLPKLLSASKKRLGRGIGSGRGKTSGRGTKGQKARGSISAGFIGGTLPFYKKMPYRRGIGNSKRSLKPDVIPLGKLAVFPANSVINLESLIAQKIVNLRKITKGGVKISGTGEVVHPLTIELPVTASAASKIEKAGGKVVNG